jgi:PAS domain S-box-containing protein
MRTTPVRDGTGRIVAGLALAHDVTTERDASKAALAAERQFRLMFENAPIGIALVALDGRLLRVNHALGEMLGYSAEELQRATFQELTHPDDLEPDLSLVDQLLRDEIHRYRLAKRYLHKSGRIVDVILHVSLARDEAKEPLYFVSQIEDLTERKKLESQLLVRDRMASLGTLAAGVAHEINNPLTYLIGNLEHISEQLEHLGGLSPSGNLRELSEAVSEARVGADRVRKIVRALKTFSRPEEVDCFPQNVHRVLDNAISMTEGEVRQRAKLVRDFRDVPPVEADEARLTQIFINLLVNAAHAIPEGHAPDNQIRIATRVEGQRVVVTVSDTGSGIAPEVLPRIFDPFFTTKPVGVGTGLGLSITHGIVSEFGGTISVDSTLGRGTTFRVELPACEVVHVPPPPLSAPAQSSPATEPPQAILIVDDDRLVATGLARALRAEHEVTIASTAREALAMFRQRSFSVVLCDLMMPDMSGMDLHSVVLAEHGEALARRFVFVTGGAFTQAAREFLDRVPNPRFEKPVQTKNLREFLRVFRPPR